MIMQRIGRPLATTMYLVGSMSAAATAQTRWQQVSMTDQIFAEWNRSGSPGCAVGVVHDGDVIFQRGYGMANLDYDLPLTSQSVFYIASTSKQFTAASIALLALRGELSLDDPVSKHIPEFPSYEYPVTIRHLLHHTSGVRDYLSLRSIAGMSFEDFFDMPWAIDIISRQESLNFEPGSEYLYSNSGYLLLAEIVGRVTGKSLPEFGHESFFEPLGMLATHWGGDRHGVVPNRVISYDERDDGTYRRWLKNFHAMGDGNLLTTVDDLTKWDRIFYDTTDTWRPLIDLMHTRGLLSNGDTLDYAFGLSLGKYRDRPTVRHGGAFLGFRTEMLRFPEDRFTSIVLCNFGSANPGSYATQLADIWLCGDVEVTVDDVHDPESHVEPPARIDVPRAALAIYAGVHRNPESPVGDALVTLGDSALNLEVAGATFLLIPTAPNRFRSENGPVDLLLEFKTNGGEQVLRVAPPDGEAIVFTRSDVGAFTSAQLEAFAGSFYSEELEATYVVTQLDRQLLVKRPGSTETVLRQVGEDEFTLAGWTLHFTRTGRDNVEGFVLDAGRVRGLRFVKQ